MKKLILLCALILIGATAYSQQVSSHVEFEGKKSLVLTAKAGDIKKQAKLSTGETIQSGCDHGACYIKILYKDIEILKNIGDLIGNLTVYEYDFGKDGDKEIVVVNEYANTAFLYIYSYRQGLIQTLFDAEIYTYTIKLKTNHIEYYLPSGLDQVWNYYQGKFWSMTPLQYK